MRILKDNLMPLFIISISYWIRFSNWRLKLFST
jgi:hypothetical protein